MLEVTEKVDKKEDDNPVCVCDKKLNSEDFWNTVTFISAQNKFFIQKFSRIL